MVLVVPEATCFTYDRYTTANSSAKKFRRFSLSLSLSLDSAVAEDRATLIVALFFFSPPLRRVVSSVSGVAVARFLPGCRHLLQKLRVNPIISRPGPRASALFRRATYAPLRVPGWPTFTHPFFKLLTTQSRRGENLTSDAAPKKKLVPSRRDGWKDRITE